MGFYGNISGSNKSAFTFDRVYTSRRAMDEALTAGTDNVFLGRFVLVEYDDVPISGWYSGGRFYATPELDPEKQVQRINNALYRDENSLANRTERGESNIYLIDFYRYTSTNGFTRLTADETPYSVNYNLDVTTYGRGYDGTVWRKTFNTTSNKYQYVMLAELNAAVPTFSTVVDAPSEFSTSPSIDTSDSTNLNYYIHMPGHWQDKFAADENGDVSIKQYTEKYTYNADGTEKTHTYTLDAEAQPVAINFNKLGFDPTVHQTTLDENNEITYTTDHTGRHYNTTLSGNFAVADDIRLWSINFPAIGNAVHDLYDKIYGFTGGARVTKDWIKTKLSDSKEYNYTTLVGAINRTRDILGYSFDYVSAAPAPTQPAADNKLYFVGTNGKVTAVYYYAKTPVFTQSNTGIYYKDGSTYRVANTDTTIIPAAERYTISSYTYKRVKLETPEEGLYGMLVALHRALGTGVTNPRDTNTVAGMIGRIDDVLRNISTSLAKNKLMATTNQGVIATTDTAFPYTTVNSTNGDDYLLDGSGTWRLPQSYELTGLNLDFVTQNNYYGNSCLHGVVATDTLGQAINKMQEEMADLQYEEQTIPTFTVTVPVASTTNGAETSAAGTLVEYGATEFLATLKYTLNKGPRKSLTLKRTAPGTATLINNTNIDPNYYVTNRADYLASATNTVTDNVTTSSNDTAPKWTLTVIDERNKSVSSSKTLTYAWRTYWGVSTAHEAADFNTYTKLVNVLTKNRGDKLATGKVSPTSMSPGAGEYMYYICPSSITPVFKVGGLEGGFDNLGNISFKNTFNNANGTNTYTVWRSTKPNLGTTTVTVS